MKNFIELLKEKTDRYVQFGTLTPNQIARALVFMKKRKEEGWTGSSVNEKVPRQWEFKVENDQIVDARKRK